MLWEIRDKRGKRAKRVNREMCERVRETDKHRESDKYIDIDVNGFEGVMANTM